MIYILFLCKVFFDLIKRLFAYYVFYAAGVGLGGLRRDADYVGKEPRDETVPFIDRVGPCAALFRKDQLAVCLHSYETIVP